MVLQKESYNSRDANVLFNWKYYTQNELTVRKSIVSKAWVKSEGS